jgi:hypothetical protein
MKGWRVGERFVHTEEVTGSNPVSPIPNNQASRIFVPGMIASLRDPPAFPTPLGRAKCGSDLIVYRNDLLVLRRGSLFLSTVWR